MHITLADPGGGRTRPPRLLQNGRGPMIFNAQNAQFPEVFFTLNSFLYQVYTQTWPKHANEILLHQRSTLLQKNPIIF